MHKRKSYFLPKSTLGAIMLVSCAAIFFSAQASAYGASAPIFLSARVFDPTGAVIPNCDVSSWTPQGRLLNRVVTSRGGKFKLSLPSTGGQVEVHCQGFATVRRTFKAGRGLRITAVFRMRIADVKQTVSVGAKGAYLNLGPASAQESESLTAQSIATLPIVGEDYIAFMSRFVDPSVTGAQGASLVVNGVEGGNFYLAPSAIKSLEVNQDEYSPAYAIAGGGRLSLITTTGKNHLHGSLGVALRDHVFDATPDFSPIKPPENREGYQATVTGPLGRSGRMHFVVSGQMKKDDTFAIVNAITENGPYVAASPTPYYRDKVGGSFYYDNGRGKQWIIGLGRTDEVHHDGSVGGLNLPSIADFNEYTGHFIDLQRTDLLSAHVLNQTRLALGQECVLTRDTTNGPQINVAGAFVSGSEQATQSYKQYILIGNELFSIGSKRHTLRIGLDIPELSIHTDNNQTDRDGIFSYPSLAAYEANQPNLYTVTRGNGLVRFTSFSGAIFVEDTWQLNTKTTIMSGARYYFQNIYHNRPTHVAPRIQLARDLGKQSHTVVRVGAGVFFDRLPTTDLAELYQFNGRRLTRYIVNDPAPNSVSITSVAPSYQVISSSSTVPYVAQWSAALEQQFGVRMTASVQGTMNAGVHQLRMLDTNAPLPPFFSTIPNPRLGQILSSQSEGHSRSQSLDVVLKIRSFHGMTQQMRYRLARSMDDTDGFSYIPADSYAPEQDASVASYDQRQNFSLLSTWPSLYKFTLGTVLQAGSGLPYNELLGEDANRDGTLNDRPAGVPRNSLRMAPQVTLDARLGRNISLSKGKDARFISLSVSIFNIANHANYDQYQGVITSPDFGKPLASGPPRRFQFNAILNF